MAEIQKPDTAAVATLSANEHLFPGISGTGAVDPAHPLQRDATTGLLPALQRKSGFTDAIQSYGSSDTDQSSESGSSTHDEDVGDNLLESVTTLFAETHKAPWYKATRTFRLAALVLHSALVVLHLFLVGIWATKVEHRFTVTLENQKLVSFLISSTTTAFGTIYSGILVFVTQTLSTRRSLHQDQDLTATHDNAAAWAGIGAAISLLWEQGVVHCRASLLGVLSVVLYLAAVLGLHITCSSLFSLVTFNRTRSFTMPTIGLPAFSSPLSSQAELMNMVDYAVGSLYFLPATLASKTNLGLREGTLLDVLETSQNYDFWTTRGCTIPIIDSSGGRGALATPSPPMNTSVSSIQLFRCSLELVKQMAVVDTQTQQVLTVNPDFKKTTSTWREYTEPPQMQVTLPQLNTPSVSSTFPVVTEGNLFIDAWEWWYYYIPLSFLLLDFNSGTLSLDGQVNGPKASVADLYLIQALNLPAANHSETLNVKLHDVENALSNIVASMFWTLGRVSSPYRATIGTYFDNGTADVSLNNLPTPPILLPGNVTAIGIFTEARLEPNSPDTAQHNCGSKTGEDPPIDGTGILHTIWLYRSHPSLKPLLKQVEHPTDRNLRNAGKVRIQLLGGELQKGNCESS
ncbi:hypothetical protein C8R45DRAFT_1181164 [Mycena sanguinolenta]|nr:hypothetical protein C8R45DRAFT_1181164 [Mycena sanguinolenta]